MTSKALLDIKADSKYLVYFINARIAPPMPSSEWCGKGDRLDKTGNAPEVP